MSTAVVALMFLLLGHSIQQQDNLINPTFLAANDPAALQQWIKYLPRQVFNPPSPSIDPKQQPTANKFIRVDQALLAADQDAAEMDPAQVNYRWNGHNKYLARQGPAAAPYYDEWDPTRTASLAAIDDIKLQPRVKTILREKDGPNL